MFEKHHQHKSVSWLWLFMAAYLLNISVDAPDGSNLKEDLRFNEQESIVELVVEKCLGFENVIAEQDDTDSNEQTTVKKAFSLDYFILPHLILSPKKQFFEQEQPNAIRAIQIPNPLFYASINPPPEV